ncbi:MAG: hypothetical protein IPJ88_11960 [Myxococcales bacterium]|nr:MAG: hypothetical protein IPJ88_11960 [Myxococcales bacterium]
MKRISLLILALTLSSLPQCNSDPDCAEGTAQIDSRCVSLDSLECQNTEQCPLRVHGDVECNANYICSYTCAEGFDDCDGDLQDGLSNGCESDLLSQQSCGGCDTSCGEEQYCTVNGQESRCANLSFSELDIAGQNTTQPLSQTLLLGTIHEDPDGNTLIQWMGKTDSIDGVVLYKFKTDHSLDWIKEIYDTTFSITPSDTVVDGDGNLWITGGFKGEDVNFAGQTLSSPASGANDFATNAFLVQFNVSTAEVNQAWAIGNSVYTRAVAISEDGQGNIYLAGSFSETWDVSTDIGLDSSNGPIFVMGLDNNATPLWARALPFDNLQDIVSDENRVYAIGFSDNNANFGVGETVKEPSATVLALNAQTGDSEWVYTDSLNTDDVESGT